MAPCKIDAEFCEDVLCAAIEGGIDYWAEEINVTRREKPGDPVGWAYTGAIITGYDEENDRTSEHEVNVDRVAKAIATILKAGIDGDRLVGFTTYEYTRQAVAGNDSGLIDADTADAIVQVAIFGRVVFG
jgi:hypothetical protein